MTADPSDLIQTSLVLNRKALGNRTACDLPDIKTFAIAGAAISNSRMIYIKKILS